jgi:formate dehydrogenase major subunit
LCFKGWHLHEACQNRNRLTKPLIREGDSLKESSWEKAFDLIAGKFKSSKEPAVIGSSKTTNEENYLLSRFARQVLKTNNIDSAFTLHYAPLSGRLSRLDFSKSIDDIENCDLIMVMGSNLHAEAPQVARRVLKASRKGAKVVVIRSFNSPLGNLADIFLRIEPDGLSRVISQISGMSDKKAETSVSAQIKEIAGLLAKAKNPVVICGEDVFKGVNALKDFSELHNLFGDKLFPVFNVNNITGTVSFGISSYIKTGELENLWKIQIPKTKGMNIFEMLKSAAVGSLKCLYIVGEDILLSAGNYNQTKAALEKTEFLVVQDLYLTETAKHAHVVLPACSSLEKSGTFTNMEGRTQHFDNAILPPGDSKPDWKIFLDIAARMGSPLPYRDIADVTKEVSAINFLKEKKIADTEIALPEEKTSTDFPLWLKAENFSFLFHSGSILRNSFTMLRECEPSAVLINPEYAKEHQLRNNDRVNIASQTGRMSDSVIISDEIPKNLALLKINLSDYSHTAIFQTGLKWAAVRIEKV